MLLKKAKTRQLFKKKKKKKKKTIGLNHSFILIENNFRFLRYSLNSKVTVGVTVACPPLGRVRPPRVSLSRERWKSLK